MSLIAVMLRLEPKLIEEIELAMDKAIHDEDSVTLFRLFEGTSKQDWYRILLRAGLRAKLREFNKKKKEIEDES